MPDEQLLEILQDWRILRLAYAASSAYVMRLAFEETKDLEAFRGLTDLAASIRARYEELAAKNADTVMLGAHLYALDLAGARDAIRNAVMFTLENPRLRGDPRLAQFAGRMGAGLLAAGRRLSPGTDLSEDELERIHAELKGREG
jgi:hypothetical protein